MKTKKELRKELESAIEIVKEIARVDNFSNEWLQFHIEETNRIYANWINQAKK